MIDKIPNHMSLSIEHNQHKNYYDNAKEHLDNMFNGERVSLKELSEEEYQRCIETDEIWEIRWYPRTTISFNFVVAPTLEECMKKIENGKWD